VKRGSTRDGVHGGEQRHGQVAWETIKTMRVGDDRVKVAVAQHLRQFETAEIKEEESIEDYSMRLSSMVQHLATLGETVAEPKVVGKFLHSVPHKYKQIVVAIQTLLDVETLTLANVTGLLKAAAEDELEAPPASVNHVGKLYLSKEAWEENWKLWKGSGGGGSSSSGGGSCDANRGQGRGRRNGGNDRDSSWSSPPGPGKGARLVPQVQQERALGP
jgi:hypothetical protein